MYLKLDDLYVGLKCRYQNCRYETELGACSNTISRLAEYDAEIIGIYDNIVVLKITVDQTTINTIPFSDNVKPYTWSVCKNDIGLSEKLWVSCDCYNSDIEDEIDKLATFLASC